MTGDPKRAVQVQFGRQASWYTISSVHRDSHELAELLRLGAPGPEASVLDVATGTGFTALAFAANCRQVIGVDLTLEMVREARRLAEDRGVSNLILCLGDAEALPFLPDTFEVVTCRKAAHHFSNLPRTLAEMTRVLKRGGKVILDDTCAPEPPGLGAVMNEWERRRDPSHVANHPPSRLRAMLEDSGLRVEAASKTHVPLEFGDWVRRSGIPRADAEALRGSFLGASREARLAFRIRTEGDELHFAWDGIVLLGVKQ